MIVSIIDCPRPVYLLTNHSLRRSYTLLHTLYPDPTMKYQTALAAALAATATALPDMSQMKEQLEQRSAEASPEPLEDVLGDLGGSLPGTGLLGTIQGLLGSVATGTLSPENIRPEPGFPFKAPGPKDSRGVCTVPVYTVYDVC